MEEIREKGVRSKDGKKGAIPSIVRELLPTLKDLNILGEANVRVKVKDALNWLVIERINGIAGAAVFSREDGQLWVYDDNLERDSEDEQEEFYSDLGVMLEPLFVVSAKLHSGIPAYANSASASLGDVTGMRLALDNRRYVGVIPIDRERQFFLVPVVLDREGYKSVDNSREYVPFNDKLYRADVQEAARRISVAMGLAN